MACQRCHQRKVKCSKGLSPRPDSTRHDIPPLTITNVETPCSNCSAAVAPCVYPIRDRNIFISENYLNSLHAQVTPGIQNSVTTTSTSNDQYGLARTSETGVLSRPQPAELLPRDVPKRTSTAAPVLKNATAEAFVSGLRKLGGAHVGGSPTAADPFNNNIWTIGGSDAQDDGSQYDYVPLDFDTSCNSCLGILGRTSPRRLTDAH